NSNADPRLGPGSERNGEHEPSGATCERHAAASRAGAANEARTTPQAVPVTYDAGPVPCSRAYQDCRAGFAGRDMEVVRATSVPHPLPDPTQDAVLGRPLEPEDLVVAGDPRRVAAADPLRVDADGRDVAVDEAARKLEASLRQIGLTEQLGAHQHVDHHLGDALRVQQRVLGVAQEVRD